MTGAESQRRYRQTANGKAAELKYLGSAKHHKCQSKYKRSKTGQTRQHIYNRLPDRMMASRLGYQTRRRLA